MTLGTTMRSLFTGPGAVARISAATMLVATLAAQHPNPTFNRIQLRDHFSFIPNWKFFAPNPATHDYHYLYRVLNADGQTSEWTSIDIIADRTMTQAFWFATRRSEKAVFDVCSEILQQMNKGIEVVRTMASYQLLCEFVRSIIATDHPDASEVKGFQISILRAGGHDENEEPEVLFVSPYIPFDPEAQRSELIAVDASAEASTTAVQSKEN